MTVETYEELIGESLLKPETQPENARRIECMLAASHRLTCDCGDLLDGKTVFVVKIDEKAIGAVCPACAKKQLRKVAEKAAREVGGMEAVRLNFTGTTASTWNRDYTSPELWDFVFGEPPKPKPPKPKPPKLTAREILDYLTCSTDDAGLVLLPWLVLRIPPERREQLTRLKGWARRPHRDRFEQGRELLSSPLAHPLEFVREIPSPEPPTPDILVFQAGPKTLQLSKRLVKSAEFWTGVYRPTWHTSDALPNSVLLLDGGAPVAVLATLSD